MKTSAQKQTVPFPKHWRGSWQGRFLTMLVISPLMCVVLWGIEPSKTLHSHKRLDVNLVYGMSTSLIIWFLTDVVRLWFFPRHRKGGAWRMSWPLALFLLGAITLGFALGNWLGDLYAGRSTYELLTYAPEKFMGFMVLTFAISALFTTFFFQQNRLQVAKQQADEATLKLLQSQLEPHMLFNTLANLRALIETSPEQATQMLDHLNDYLRATLSASRVQMHTLATEFERLADYLHLMRVRLGSRLAFELVLPQDLRENVIPSLLLQPLVENAIRHGIEPSSHGGTIVVKATQIDEPKPHLQLCISDTGVGIAKSGASRPSRQGTAFGLMQIKARLQTIYGAQARFALKANVPTGVIATIALPLHQSPP